VTNRALIGRWSGDGTILVSPARILHLQSCRRALEMFSALDLSALVKIWRRLTRSFFDPYRPELHYMRGPGPKWREKQTHSAHRGASVR